MSRPNDWPRVGCHVMVAPTVWVSSLIITIELVPLTWFCFSWSLAGLCQWHFAEQITVKKKSWQSDWQRDVGGLNVTKHASVTSTVWATLLIIRTEYVTLTWFSFQSEFNVTATATFSSTAIIYKLPTKNQCAVQCLNQTKDHVASSVDALGAN